MARKTLAGMALALLLPHTALAVGAPPHADLRIYAAAPHLTWDGTGDAWEAIDLCLASTTGRYRLRVMSQSGGMLTGPDRLRYTLSLTDGAGVSHEVALQDQMLVAIEGSVPPDATCNAGPNASLKLKADRQELLKGQAGRYLDRLRLAIDPL